MSVLAAVAGAVDATHLDAIVERLVEQRRKRVPEFFVSDTPGYHEAVRTSTRDHARRMLAFVGQSETVPRTLPAGVRLEVELAVQYGASLDALLRTYRLGEHLMLEQVAQLLEEHRGPVPASAYCTAANRLYRYTDITLPLVRSEFDAVRARLAANGEVGRFRRVQAVLAGDDSVGIGYPIAGEHVAVLVERARPGVEQELRRAGGELDLTSLVIRTPRGEVWAWYTPVSADPLTEALTRGRFDGIAGLAQGDFRSAHDRARVAASAGGHRPGLHDLRWLTLEAMAIGGRSVAGDLVRQELGPLLNDNSAQETLCAWFTSHESVPAAARMLGIAPRTVTYRLRRVERLLGHTIAQRRAELEFALRLHPLIGAPETGRIA